MILFQHVFFFLEISEYFLGITESSPAQSSLLDDETPYKPAAKTFSDVQLVGLTPESVATRSAPP